MSGFQPYEGPNEIVERLRAELAAAKEQLVINADELAAMQKQRDEARRELCRVIGYQRQDRYDPMEIAAERGWDCFKEGGGA